MPAAAPAPRPPPPPARPAPGGPPGHRGLCDHSLRYLSSRLTERKLQAPWLPAGRGAVDRPCPGPRGPLAPAPGPQPGPHCVHVHAHATTESGALRPRVVTVVKPGGHPPRRVTLLLHRRCGQTFEQLLADVSEALGSPRWKGDRVRKLFNLRGREVRSVSDFFRDGDAFIAVGKEPLTLKSIQAAVDELYPGKARAPTPGQHTRVPSPRPRSRLCSKAPKGGPPHCGEAQPPKSCGEAAAGPKAAIARPGKIPREPGPEDGARAQKTWARGPREAEPGGKAPRDAAPRGEQHPGVEIERTSGEIVRCETCQRERALGQSLRRRERLSLGTSQLDLGTGPHHDDADRLVRTRSCRRSPEAHAPGGEDGWKADGPRGRPRNPTQEPRPGKNPDQKEDADAQGQEAQPAREEGKKDARSKHGGGWNLREPHADPEKPPRSRGEEQEAEKERKPGGRKAPPREAQPAPGVEKEPRMRAEESRPERPGGRRRRPAGILWAGVEQRYEAGRVIGDGNFAVVKECRHRESGQAYAMKVIDKAKLKGKEDMVDSEILIIQSLSHPNIVKLREVYETDAEIYLIMEYVQGGDLFDAILEHVRFPEREAALLLTDLCKALVHMHDKNIVHRDLKPENLLVQRNEDKSTTLKLADFGLAKHVVRPVFTVCGTPTYVAPEILSEKGYGLEVDMWAAGVILYILLCGFPPFRSLERDQDELFDIIQLGHFEFLAPYWDNISEAAKDLVSRLLVVDPKKRYTAHQVLKHPWIENAGKTSAANPGKERKEASPPGSEGQLRGQQAPWSPPPAPAQPSVLLKDRG